MNYQILAYSEWNLQASFIRVESQMPGVKSYTFPSLLNLKKKSSGSFCGHQAADMSDSELNWMYFIPEELSSDAKCRVGDDSSHARRECSLCWGKKGKWEFSRITVSLHCFPYKGFFDSLDSEDKFMLTLAWAFPDTSRLSSSPCLWT